MVPLCSSTRVLRKAYFCDVRKVDRASSLERIAEQASELLMLVCHSSGIFSLVNGRFRSLQKSGVPQRIPRLRIVAWVSSGRYLRTCSGQC